MPVGNEFTLPHLWAESSLLSQAPERRGILLKEILVYGRICPFVVTLICRLSSLLLFILFILCALC
jgi:hypothetical protein